MTATYMVDIRIDNREASDEFQYRLAAYTVTGKTAITPLDTLHLENTFRISKPRVDHHTGLIYIPCSKNGISVVKYDCNKLVVIKTLRCVEIARALAVVSQDILYVCSWHSVEKKKDCVCVVDVSQDRVTTRLQPPRGVREWFPVNITILGDTLLVKYVRTCMVVSASIEEKLVIYRHNASTPGKLVTRPQGLQNVSGLSTDQHSSFLVADIASCKVFVLGISGNLTHTISIPEVDIPIPLVDTPIPGVGIPVPGFGIPFVPGVGIPMPDVPTVRQPWDCTVVGRQLWMGCCTEDVIVMSSQ